MVSSSPGPVRAQAPALSSQMPSLARSFTAGLRHGVSQRGSSCARSPMPPRGGSRAPAASGDRKAQGGLKSAGGTGSPRGQASSVPHSLPRPVSAWSTLLVRARPRLDTGSGRVDPAVASGPAGPAEQALSQETPRGRSARLSGSVNASVLCPHAGTWLQGGLGVPGSEQAGLQPVPLPPDYGAPAP